MSTPAATPVVPLPLRIGSQADLAVLRRLFARADFAEGPVCQRLKLKLMHEVDRRASRLRLSGFDATDPQAVLIRLFVLGYGVPVEAFAAALEDAERAALAAADLVRFETVEDVPCAVCPVRLLPVTPADKPLLLAGDRELGVEGRRVPLPADVVFPPHSRLTRQFLSVLPGPEEGTLLDLCTGAGAAALLAGHRLPRVAALDIAGRSVHFTRFNAWLNEQPHVQALEGDLYEPLGDEQFRYIVAHPPYVPTFRSVALFRDGGELGDVVVRRIVEGLTAHLEVGGTVYIVSMGIDTTEGLFEQRARSWMGPDGDAFDIVFGTASIQGIEEFAGVLADGAINPEPDEEERRVALFRDRGVTAFVHGALVARRLPAGTKGETHRVKVEASTTSRSFEWFFRWTAAGRQPGFAERLLQTRPRLLDGTRLEVENVMQNGDLVPVAFRLGNAGQPFPSKIETDPWIVRLATSLDGRVTLAAALARLREAGHLPDAITDRETDQVIRFLVERGMIGLEIPD
jgi:hypothetical protein